MADDWRVIDLLQANVAMMEIVVGLADVMEPLS
jgi:hypothetical protein